MLLAASRPWTSLALFALLSVGCRKKTEQERLRAQLETNGVYFYLAVKSAVSSTDDPGTRVVRAQFHRLERGMHSAPRPTGQLRAPEPITAQDMADVAGAIWRLRGEGRRRLAMGTGDGLRLVAPVMEANGAAPTALALLDLETEHAVLMTALLVAKFHPRTPVPIPPELPLYEAWRTQPDRIVLRGLIPIVRGLRAVVYGLNDYCDLASSDANSPELTIPPPTSNTSDSSLSTSLNALTLTDLGLSPDEVARVLNGCGAVAHLSAGACYQLRGDGRRGDVELERFVGAAGRAGVPPEDLVPLRAALAYRRGDMVEVRRLLEEARRDPRISEAARQELDILLRDFSAHDDRALARHFDKVWFTLLLGRTLYHLADRAGLLDSLKRTALGSAAVGSTLAAEGVVSVSHGASRSTGEGLHGARAWLDRHRPHGALGGAR